VTPVVNSRLFLRFGLLLVGLAWTAPFLQPYHRFPLTGFYSEWLAFALGLAAMLPLLRQAVWRDPALPVIALAPLGLIVVLGIQAALGRVPYAEQVLTASLYLLWAALLAVLGHALKRGLPVETTTTTLAWFLLAGGLLNAVAGLVQHYTPFAAGFLVMRKEWPVVYGNLGQPNHYAACISLALASAAYLYSRRRLHGALVAGCAVLFLVVLALAASRSPWLYLVAFIALALLVHRSQGDDASRRLVALALGLLPAFIAAQWLVTLPLVAPAGAPVLTSAARLFQVASGIEPRLELWCEAWWMFLDAPLLGAGLGQFAWHHFLHLAAGDATAATGVFNHAHNIVLQLMAETGIVGTLIIVGAVVGWLADLRRVKVDLEKWWLLALLTVIGIHSLLEYPLWYAYFLGVAAFLLGFGAERSFGVRFGGAARAAIGLAVVLGCVNLAAVIPPYRDFEHLVFGSGPQASRQVSDAAFTETMMRAHREPLLTPYVELAFAFGATVDETQLRQKLELTTRAMHFAPTDVVVYRQALLLALAGERAAALTQLDRSLRAYPSEAGTVVVELEKLARRHPVEFTPLLELATAKYEDSRVLQEKR
jgi:O-antigen ligase